ncbi:hypothetical protein HAX54_001522 [Datura stramonium]|uniref:Pectinesterase inhibitor domain-containing protein n=1 Tax=Datura stramonium TaxID=4076 RepID=A0ABS8RSI8_DATST|nr:hypothetical protein [Datura stramonium]
MTTSSPSSSFSSTLVLCLVVVSLMTPSKSNPLADMCIKSKSPKFCLQVLGLNPHRSPYELTREAVNLALKTASKTTKKIHTFLNHTKDDILKGTYNYCLDYYQTSIDILSDVEEYLLKKGLYSYVNHVGYFVQEAGLHCEEKFQRIEDYVYDSTLTKNNKELRMFGSIIMAAADLLTNSTSSVKENST